MLLEDLALLFDVLGKNRAQTLLSRGPCVSVNWHSGGRHLKHHQALDCALFLAPDINQIKKRLAVSLGQCERPKRHPRTANVSSKTKTSIPGTSTLSPMEANKLFPKPPVAMDKKNTSL